MKKIVIFILAGTVHGVFTDAKGEEIEVEIINADELEEDGVSSANIDREKELKTNGLTEIY